MSQTPDYPASVVEDAVFQQTYEALVAFTGEDNVSLEQVDRVLLEILCAGKAYDPATFASALCLQHFRDFADLSDYGSALPAPVMAVMQDQYALDRATMTVQNLIDLTCSKDRAIAQLRVAQHIQLLREKRAGIVNDDDQIEFFSYSVMTKAMLGKMTANHMWEYVAPELLLLLVDEARAAHKELQALDSDLFSDLADQTDQLAAAVTALEPRLRQAKQERDLGIAAAEALARRRIEHPEEFVFPRPISAYEQLKTLAHQKFKL